MLIKWNPNKQPPETVLQFVMWFLPWAALPVCSYSDYAFGPVPAFYHLTINIYGIIKYVIFCLIIMPELGSNQPWRGEVPISLTTTCFLPKRIFNSGRTCSCSPCSARWWSRPHHRSPSSSQTCSWSSESPTFSWRLALPDG